MFCLSGLAKYRTLLLPAVFTLGLVLLCITSPLIFTWLNEAWLEIRAPYASSLDIPDPLLLLYEIPGSSNKLAWSADGNLIVIYSSKRTISNPELPDIVSIYNLETGEPTIDVPGIITNLSQPINTLEKHEDEYSRVECISGDIVVQTRGIDGSWGEYGLQILNHEEDIEELLFSPKQSEDEFHVVLSDFRFSPRCAYLAIILYGDIAPDSMARYELWILDVQARKLEFAVMGRWSPFLLFDYPVQEIIPDWSPDESRIVFGDGDFGLEIYDVLHRKRELLAGPWRNLYVPKWSHSGKYIAANSRESGLDSIVILTLNGAQIAYSPECQYILLYEWAPEKDQLAYICSGLSYEVDTLWLWTIEE
jgi:WD40 repeat protein